MADSKKIKTALISVFHKDGLEELLKKLNEEGVKFLSTGGTQAFIESLGYACEKVENVTHKKEKNAKIPVQGEDVETEIPISVIEGFYGQTKKISLNFSLKDTSL